MITDYIIIAFYNFATFFIQSLFPAYSGLPSGVQDVFTSITDSIVQIHRVFPFMDTVVSAFGFLLTVFTAILFWFLFKLIVLRK